uniref:Uncharacterized protein n=1 Tax=Arundo donax TaxID=35708 RepID=A0A0A8ZNG1_ARUDO
MTGRSLSSFCKPRFARRITSVILLTIQYVHTSGDHHS